jgi:hypothetical protein
MTNRLSIVRLWLLLTACVFVMGAMPVAAQTAGRYAGRSLADVLRDLRSLGLKVAFSSELVRPEMRVTSEPTSTVPRQILDDVLEPHGLRAAAGPKGTWLVVRARPAGGTAASATVGTATQAPAAVVAGQVVTGANKVPVVGAAIEAGGRHAVTDGAGRFVIEATPGALVLQVTAKGFVTQRVDLTVVAGITAVEIALVVSPEFRESVTVSGLESKEAPASPHIVLAPVAVQGVPGTGDNIFRALQALPGVSATDDFTSRIAVRGGGPDQNLTIMDGVEIHNPYRLLAVTSAFNPEIADRFEFTAGGFGVQYGDRMSSILVVDNRPGTTRKAIAGSATASLTDANVVLEGKLPGRASGSWLVTGRLTYFDLIADHDAKEDYPGFQDLQAKGVWDPKPGHRLTLFVLRSRESAEVSDLDNRVEERNLVTTLRKAARNDVAAVSYSAPFGARASSRTVAAWYQYNDTFGVHGSQLDPGLRSNCQCDAIEGMGTKVVAFTRDLEVRDVSLRQELTWQAGQHHVFEAGFDAHALRTAWGWTIGADMTLDEANGSSIKGLQGFAGGLGAGLPSLLQSTRDTTRAAVWFQDRYRPSAAVRLEPGVRIDHSSLSGETVVSPRLGVRVELTPRTRLRGAVGRYTQSPGYEKLLQADYFVDLTSADSRQLTSERSLHVIGAIEHALTSSVTARIEAYSKTFDRLIVGRLETPAETAARIARYNFPDAIASSVPSAPVITAIPDNSATGHAYGFDVYVERPPRSRRDRMSGWASYTWGVANITSYGRQYPADYDRRHAASLVGTVWLSRRLDLGATLRMASGLPMTPVTGIRVAATPTADGRLVPMRDQAGLYTWTLDHGGVSNLNSARAPLYARLDMRVTFNPKNVTGRWQIYAEVLNVLKRNNINSFNMGLRYDRASDRPRLVIDTDDSGFPPFPTFGVRYRF